MYATIEQANLYVQSYYSSTDPLRISWETLDNSDKQVYLNRAEQIIDQLPLKGTPTQLTKAFPRKPFEKESMQKAQEATIELAIQLSCDSEEKQRVALQNQGVKQYKIGDLSETFKDNVSVDVGLDTFTKKIVYPFLKDWMGGGFDIRGEKPCHTRIRK